MNLTAQQFADATGCTLDVAQKWVKFANSTMERFEINTPVRQAHFLSQYAHETGQFMRMSENLNYSAEGLLATFPTHFTKDEVKKFERHPMAIASRVYANRYGNGNEESGDGWLYRGRGWCQLTFKDNYKAFSDAVGIDFVANPDLLLTPGYAAMVGGWYWRSHGCNSMADMGEIRGITKAINGGYNGLDTRIARLEVATTALC